MDNQIKILSPDVINKIAAGEVVERPASIAKEFLENAIDAKASEIVISLEKSGIDAITVNDNGNGMNQAEAKTAILQHATSKITSAEDLFHISSLGFRGEALASIASIANLSIHTYNNKTAPVLLTVKEQNVSVKTGQGRAQGTTIKASDIFASVPVRRKFLKSETTEYKYILETFIEIALANPGIGFKLTKNGKETLHYPVANEAISRILQINPELKRDDLIPVFYDDPTYKLSGYLIHPEKSNRTTTQQFLTVNGRYIHSPLINKAVKEGFGTALMHEMQPGFFLFFQPHSEVVDVNVHPRKLEVRFSDPGRVYSLFKRAVETALTKELQQNLHQKFRGPENTNNLRSVKAPSMSVQQSLDFSKELLQETSKILKPISKNSNNTDAYNNPDTSPIVSWQTNDFLQVFDTYLVTSRNDKVLFIDQHAAAERVNFEKISKQLKTNQELSSQEMLLPEKLTFSPAILSTIKTNLELFNKIGYKLANFSSNSCDIVAIPTITIGHEPVQGFYEIVNDLQNAHQQDHSSRWNEIKDKLIATLACHASIRAGEHLTTPVINKLIQDLFSCNLPYSCPHGRPIIWELDRYQLEKNFKRKL